MKNIRYLINKWLMNKALLISSIILLETSFIILLGLMMALTFIRLTTDKEFDYLWFCSKILTIKNLIKINHNSKIF